MTTTLSAHELEGYLLTQLDTNDGFFKSRHVARELDASKKRVGQAFAHLESQSSTLQVTRWGGNSNGTTWYVKRLSTAETSPARDPVR
jgi:hypothetical protein